MGSNSLTAALDDVAQYAGKAQALLETRISPLLSKKLSVFVDAAKDRLTSSEELRDEWYAIEKHWVSTFSTTDLYNEYLQSTRRLALALFFTITIEYTGQADQNQLDRLVSNDLVMICGDSDQRRLAAQTLANGDEAALGTAFEQIIARPAQELLLDVAYVQRRFQTAATGARLLDLLPSPGERRALIEKDRETITILGGVDKGLEEGVPILEPYLVWQAGMTSSLSIPISQTLSGTQSPGLVRRSVGRQPYLLKAPTVSCSSQSTDSSLKKFV